MLLIVFACSKPAKKSTYSKLKNANYDFKEWKNIKLGDLTFKVPIDLKYYNQTEHVLSNNGISRAIPELGIFFTVEKYYSENIEDVFFEYEDFYNIYEEGTLSKEDSISAVQHNYLIQRTESLKYYDFSLLEEYNQNHKLPTLIQVINGSANAYSEELFYIISTVQKDDTYYVFQLVANEEMCNYLYDDFLKILNSAH